MDTVLVTYALRNALLPVVTTLGMVFGFMLGSSVIVERVFSLPGAGALLVDSIGARDYPVLQGALLVVVAAAMLVNLLVDLSYRVIDPRVRVGGRAT